MFKRVATPTTWDEIFANVSPMYFEDYIEKQQRDYYRNASPQEQADMGGDEDKYVESYLAQHNPDDKESYKDYLSNYYYDNYDDLVKAIKDYYKDVLEVGDDWEDTDASSFQSKPKAGTHDENKPVYNGSWYLTSKNGRKFRVSDHWSELYGNYPSNTKILHANIGGGYTSKSVGHDASLDVSNVQFRPNNSYENVEIGEEMV